MKILKLGWDGNSKRYFGVFLHLEHLYTPVWSQYTLVILAKVETLVKIKTVVAEIVNLLDHKLSVIEAYVHF